MRTICFLVPFVTVMAGLVAGVAIAPADDSTAPKQAQPGWWAFQPPRQMAVPEVEDAAWQAHPIDAFIARQHDRQGLQSASPADRRTLLRRVSFDLHGLPPSPTQIERFLNDDSPAAYEQLIQQLLDSPRYGERWGRYWLDVVRYADTGGFETDIYFPNAWRYRDFVIKSFNDDKPFDRFVTEQIAADQVWPDDIELRGTFDIPPEKQQHLDARVGTTLFTIGPVYHEAALNGHQLRYEWLSDVVDTLGDAFLGLTMSCSRCHDHKFDPITQRDYHGLMAIFANSCIRDVPVVHKMTEFGYYSAYPLQLRVEQLKSSIQRLDAAVRDRAIDEIKAGFPAEVVAAFDTPRSERTAQQARLAKQIAEAVSEAGLNENAGGGKTELPYREQERKQRRLLLQQVGEAVLKANFDLPRATVLGQAEVHYPVQLAKRGDWRQPGEQVAPGFPSVFNGAGLAALDVSGQTSQPLLARKLLAEWLTSPAHPLTARVIVNRLWQGHFGRGIVATPNNFGLQGEPPTHPELLDWLATTLVDKGWSIKKMHHLIMTSRTYRMSSAFEQANAQRDPANRFLWRMNRRRLQAETLRDAVLTAAGSLNLEMGGQPVVPPLTKEEQLGMWNLDQWPETLDQRQHTRRSVYLYVKRSFLYPMFTTFDFPDSSASCGRRDVTTVAPQALMLLNSEFMQQQAKVFGERLQKNYGDSPESWIEGSWLLGLGRPPTDQEVALAMALFSGSDDLSPTGESDTLLPLTKLALIVLNMNEFIYVD